MIFMDENMDEFYSKRWQQTLFLQIIEQKKWGGKTYVSFFQKKFDTWIIQVTFQSHTSYFLNMKYIQTL
jgi:hypothetical protein